MNLKKTAAVCFAAALLSACAGGTQTTSSDAAAQPAETTAETTTMALPEGGVLNFDPPKKGDKIGIIKVKDYGEIKFKLFPEAAPLACENFEGLCSQNYYDELIFHRIIPQFMIQGGDPKGTGKGGQSMWGGSFDGGIPEGLYHFSGAVAYANSGSTSTNGSQFYIVNTDIGYIYGNDIESYGYPQEVADLYREHGGTPFLDGRYTVFGQVFEGYEYVQQIAQVETDDSDKPLKQVQMESVRVVEYDG
ncbi:MAG: peptidylprolyl isomerase [Oscillospiraceae bacterium]|nr:peptidylprolyl isomerase [Oscillospiraceae bacterium]